MSEQLTAWESGILGALAQQLSQGAVEPSMVALLKQPQLWRVRSVVLMLAAYLLLGEERSGQE